MKYAFSTLGCPGWSFDQVLDCAVQHGFQGLEIRGIAGEMRLDRIPEFAPENAEKTKERLKKANLSIVCFGTSCSFHDESKTDAMLQEGFAAIDVASRMGAPYIRVFGDAINDSVEGDEERVIRAVAQGIDRLLEYAEGKNVTVLQEVHGNFNHAHRILGVAEHITRPGYGIIWDIAHSDKTYGDNFEEFYRQVRHLVRHVHVKDHLRDEKFSLTPQGEGKIPVKAIVNMLNADGYDGFYSLEWEKAWHPELPEPEAEFPRFVPYMEQFA